MVLIVALGLFVIWGACRSSESLFYLADTYYLAAERWGRYLTGELDPGDHGYTREFCAGRKAECMERGDVLARAAIRRWWK